MSIESSKIMNLADGKVLYDDLRGRVEAKYTKLATGIPASDIEAGVIPDPTELIDDTAGSGDTDVTWSADKSQTEVDSVVTISDTQPQQSGNKIWIEEDAEEVYTIPTTAEMTAGLAAKVNKPSSDGTSGQLLRTNGDGSTYWDNDASATDIANAVTDWLDDNVPTGQTLVVDSSLTVSGAAADAKKTGDEISDLKNEIEDIEDEIQSISSVPTNVRASILTLFKNAVFKDTGLTDEIAIVESWAEAVTAITLNHTTISINGTGTSQLTATTTPPGGSITWSSSDTSVATVNSSGLVTGCSNGTATITAMCGDISARCTATVTGFATLESIEATYTQSGTVYENEALSNLVPDLVVVANYSDSTTATLTSDQYTLSGSLVTGTSTITVSFGGKTDTFTVTVSAIPTVVSISAVYTQGIVYENDDVDDLKSNLVVTALYDDTSTETVDANEYTLSGSLAVGTSTITVTYQSKTTTFTVVVYGFEAQRKKTIAGGAGSTAKVSANNSRCLNIGTNGDNEVKNSDNTSSGLYPVPIRAGTTKIHADLGDEIIITLQVLQWDSANNYYTKAFGGEWHNTAKEYSLTQYNDGTYFCAIIGAKKTSATIPTPDSTFDFTDYVFSKYEIYFE